MRERAKREIDLTSFLVAHGWSVVPDDAASASRQLVGPDGTRVVISRARDGHWLWFDRQAQVGGSIVDACTRLLHLRWGKTMAELRRVVADPPNPMDVTPDSYSSAHQSAGNAGPAPSKVEEEKCERPHSDPTGVGVATLQPLGARGRTYLTQRRHLSEETVDAFAHSLRERASGAVHAPHHQTPGEQRGLSLWVGFPVRSCSRLIVAEEYISGLSAWELLPANLRAITGIASTGGPLTAAGAARLELLLTGMRDYHLREQTGRSVWLVDATNWDQAHTAAREARLAATAQGVGVHYRRARPDGEAQDWTAALVAVKDQTCQQDVVSTEGIAYETPDSAEPGDDEPPVIEIKRGRRR